MRHQRWNLLANLAAALCLFAGAAVAQELTLVINPRTGQTTIQNVGGAAVNMDGYLLASPDGALNVGGWTSLETSGIAGWREGNPAPGHLSELNLGSASAISVGGSLNLGAAYAVFAPAAIGQVEPPVSFDFHVADGATVPGDVLFAPANNLVLVVNPATGAASIQNQSNFSVDIDGYIISSPTGVLSPTGWTSFLDSGVGGWREANPAANHLSEVNLAGMRSFGANGAPISIGTAVNPLLLTDQSDLAFEYHIEGGGTVQGGVAFALPSAEPADGDFDGDGVVDGADFLRWQRGQSPGGPTAVDLNKWRTNYGAGGAAAATSAATQSVPEPCAAGIAAVAGLGGMLSRRRR